MNDMTGKISTNPVYELALCYQKTAALIAASRHNIFTIVGGDELGAPEIAARCGASEKGVRILCDFLVVIGVLAKSGESYANVAGYRKYFDRSLGSQWLDSLDFLAAPEMIALFFDDPAQYVRRGGSAGLANVAQENPIWEKFARAMIPFASITARLAASKIRFQAPALKRVLDVAAGHGCYGIELAKLCPQATVVALDWKNVLGVATENAIAAGVMERYEFLPGSLFEVDFGLGYDAILLPNILHHFGVEKCCDILIKASEALAPDGRVFIIDFVPDNARISPSEAVAFAFWMLATTPSGDAYTLGELEAMARTSGFTNVQSWRLHPTPSTIVALSQAST